MMSFPESSPPWHISHFDYELPLERIAQFPSLRRDYSRLLVLKRDSGELSHGHFGGLLEYLEPGDLLVLNNAKVIKARLLGKKENTAGKVEFLLERYLGAGRFQALCRPARLRPGQEVIFAKGKLRATVIRPGEVEFNLKDRNRILGFGQIPLPPYIRRRPVRKDQIRYQTVYARREGAIAAPTAGLHFTGRLLERIRKKGVRIAYITLLVGYGSFRPIREEDIRKHRMDEEYCRIPQATCRLINQTRCRGGRVIAVGTTTTRALETAALSTPRMSSRSCPVLLKSWQGWTALFIYPGFKFSVVDALVTNFHLPRSSLLLLVSAFAGHALIRKSYAMAIQEGYRFYSYGDAMLIL